MKENKIVIQSDVQSAKDEWNKEFLLGTIEYPDCTHCGEADGIIDGGAGLRYCQECFDQAVQEAKEQYGGVAQFWQTRTV